MPEVTLLTRTTAFGYYSHNFVGLWERVTDHLPPDGAAGAAAAAAALARAGERGRARGRLDRAPAGLP